MLGLLGRGAVEGFIYDNPWEEGGGRKSVYLDGLEELYAAQSATLYTFTELFLHCQVPIRSCSKSKTAHFVSLFKPKEKKLINLNPFWEKSNWESDRRLAIFTFTIQPLGNIAWSKMFKAQTDLHKVSSQCGSDRGLAFDPVMKNRSALSENIRKRGSGGTLANLEVGKEAIMGLIRSQRGSDQRVKLVFWYEV